MCQLLGMSAKQPTDIGFSFAGFKERGGNTDHHSDGFGVAFFEIGEACQDDKLMPDKQTERDERIGLRLFHDDRPSFESPVAELIKNHPIKAVNVIAHIRKATEGRTCLANTHPFVREVWGEEWVFAHNGQMSEAFTQRCKRLMSNGNAEYCQPVGNTDSEIAFCYLINRLKSTFKTRPSEPELFKFLTTQCRYLSANGLFNCLLSNGDWHLAYASTLLFYLTRTPPFGNAELSDNDMSINFGEVTNDNDKVSIIVTIPLTKNEDWTQLAVDECVIFRAGEVIFKDTPTRPKYLSIDEGIAIARKVGASV